MKRIISDKEYEAIMSRIDELVEIVDDSTPVTDKNYVELDVLTDFVVEYEKEHYSIGKPKYAEKEQYDSDLVFV
ncbi:MAG: hypothetical protein LBN23_02250 [Paludibacter sp.]|jgi:HTH-type transcriptional regulator/antitoxin HigA|nr:hypothetical protein [Paludibacter sp.]